MSLQNEINSEMNVISKTLRTGQGSCTLTIPKRLAIAEGIHNPSYVIIKKIKQGLLIKKLELSNNQYRDTETPKKIDLLGSDLETATKQINESG